jgi:hypothetical protein
MAVAYFQSPEDCDLIEVELVGANGGQLAVRLFVDSGFTGASTFVLSEDLRELALANLSAAHGQVPSREGNVACSSDAAFPRPRSNAI